MIEEIIIRYELWLRSGIIYFNPYYPTIKEWEDSVKEKIKELEKIKINS